LRELNELNFARFDAKVEQRWAELRAEFQTEIAQLRAEMREGFARLETRLTRRMFGFWVAQAATTAALVLGVVKLVK
jgi:glutathione S-transferase